MGKQHITIHDIARELNVSASTVSRALQNHPRISQTTRQAVHELASRYNYQPNVVATSLRKGKGNTVGVIVPRINRNFFANVIGGMEEVLTAAGYHLMICQTQERYKNEIAAVRTLVNARVNAIILSISMDTTRTDHINSITDKGIGLFFFDRVPEEIKAGSVAVNDRLGAYHNVKHLLSQGYRKIVHIAGAEHISIYRDRKRGYLDAMEEAGIRVHSSWIIQRPLVREGGESAFRACMELSLRPDAFFCAGDFAALGVMQAALGEGLKVPENLGISGFANEPFTEFMQPSLTTVDQRGGEMGRKVAEMFLNCREGLSPAGECERIILNPELIIRRSSNKTS